MNKQSFKTPLRAWKYATLGLILIIIITMSLWLVGAGIYYNQQESYIQEDYTNQTCKETCGWNYNAATYRLLDGICACYNEDKLIIFYHDSTLD